MRHSYKFFRDESDLDVLYEFVKFVDDHYHKAICLTKYFPRDSQSYRALEKKVNLLAEAMENVEKFQEQPEGDENCTCNCCGVLIPNSQK